MLKRFNDGELTVQPHLSTLTSNLGIQFELKYNEPSFMTFSHPWSHSKVFLHEERLVVIASFVCEVHRKVLEMLLSLDESKFIIDYL